MKDLWPAPADVERTIADSITKEMFTSDYADVFAGDERWQSLPTPRARPSSGTGVDLRPQAPYFEGMQMETTPVEDISGARVLAKLGDSVTTDHISPAGSIKADSPAGKYLAEHGVDRKDFNSYGSRRGKPRGHDPRHLRQHPAEEPAARRRRGRLHPQLPGGREQSTIFDASATYQEAGVPLVILAGKEYGSGSSRDWAAKGTRLLGSRPSSPRATSASTAPTSSAWVCSAAVPQGRVGAVAWASTAPRRSPSPVSPSSTRAAPRRRSGSALPRTAGRPWSSTRSCASTLPRGRLLPQRRHPAVRPAFPRPGLRAGGAGRRQHRRGVPHDHRAAHPFSAFGQVCGRSTGRRRRPDPAEVTLAQRLS